MTGNDHGRRGPTRVRAWSRAAGYTFLHRARSLSATARVTPDFLIVGAQKAGTSTLAARLFAHPQVLPPLRREVHYFDLNHRRPEAWYRAHFPTVRERVRRAQAHGRAITGESSPYYLFHPAAPRRIVTALPEVRIIAVLREPVARAVSEYHHAVRLGFESRPIEAALDVDRRMVEDLPPGAVPWDDPEGWPRRRSYLERGHYAVQLARWFEVLPRERMLILSTDDLRDQSALVSVQRFLALDEVRADETVRNVNDYQEPPTRLCERLAAHYEPHNARLRELLGFLPWDEHQASRRGTQARKPPRRSLISDATNRTSATVRMAARRRR
jgi:hypothetical protein